MMAIMLNFKNGGSGGQESACNVGDPGSTPGSRRCPGEGNVYPSNMLAWRIHRQRSLVSYGPWDHKELDTTEQLTQSHPSAAGNVPGPLKISNSVNGCSSSLYKTA